MRDRDLAGEGSVLAVHGCQMVNPKCGEKEIKINPQCSSNRSLLVGWELLSRSPNSSRYSSGK